MRLNSNQTRTRMISGNRTRAITTNHSRTRLITITNQTVAHVKIITRCAPPPFGDNNK